MKNRVLFTTLSSLAALAPGLPVQAQVYVHPVGQQAFTPIASIPGIGTVTTLSFSPSTSLDDNSVAITLPFTFNYLGADYTRINASTNGYITFGTEAATSYSNVGIGGTSSPNQFIAPFWDDLEQNAAGNVRTGVVGTSPSRIFVVEVGPGHRLGSSGTDMIYQVQLYEAGGRFDFSVSGALAGSSLPLDPTGTAADLGFAAAFDNSLDAVGDRDFVAEALFDLALLGVHLSRVGEEVVLWASDELGFLRLDDAYSTGSSMLPQKKNPDIAELARGKSGRLIGNLTGLLATLKGLPLAYNRDLQEDKEPLFDSVDQVILALSAMDGLLATSTFDTVRMAAAADSPYAAATDLAEHLVGGGMPFREAHAVVGEIVRGALGGQGSMADLVSAHPALGADAVALLAPGVSVTRRTTRGGAGPGPVADQIDRFRSRLAMDEARLTR